MTNNDCAIDYCSLVALNLPYQKTCPTEGAFIAYKALENNLLATLLIPKSAKRVNTIGRKCRASEAKVLAIKDIATGAPVKSGYSKYNPKFEYKVGRTVRPASPLDENPAQVCTYGIHFFMTEEEAILFARSLK